MLIQQKYFYGNSAENKTNEVDSSFFSYTQSTEIFTFLLMICQKYSVK